jgi:hypothetical protein
MTARVDVQPASKRVAKDRLVVAEVYAECPFSIAQDYAADFFKRAEMGEEDVRVPFAFLGVALHHRVGLTFGIHSDDTEAGRAHDEIQLRWTTGTRLLPDFHGTVRFRIEMPGTRVLVSGLYRAPFGFAGKLFDDVAGKRIAIASVTDLARRIAAHLEASNAAWRRRISMESSPVT